MHRFSNDYGVYTLTPVRFGRSRVGSVGLRVPVHLLGSFLVGTVGFGLITGTIVCLRKLFINCRNSLI